MTDEELLLAYRKTNDSDWLGHLLQRYTILLLGVAMKYLKDRAGAEDAVQQIFLKALTHLPKQEISNFKGWLYILTRNHCLQELRNKQHYTLEAALGNVEAAASNNEEIILHEYTLEQMGEGLKHLNEEQRTCITLFYLEKKSYVQIISVTGYTFMQVKSFIQNGKRNLKVILIKKLGELT